MTPIEIKHYLSRRRLATLNDVAMHFRMDAGTVLPMMDMWIRKGRVRKHNNASGCRKGCCKCDPATITTYEWID
jgi:hypothetical protein